MNEPHSTRTLWIELIVLLLLTAMAAGFRFYDLGVTPPGFHHDEAFEAVEALKVLGGGGYHPLFFPGNFGVEPMFIYLTALAFKLFGATPTVMRAAAALVGGITVPALYWLGKELERASRYRLRGLGLGAAAALAGLYWHVNFSRVGIEPILVPLDAILVAGFLWRGLRTRRWINFALSGLFLGLSPYTYPAGRLLPFLVLVFVLYGWLVERSLWRGHGKHLVLLGSVAFLIFLPLGITFARQPELLTLRTSQVAVFSKGAGNDQTGNTILDNLIDTALGFSFVGDQNPRSNLPGRPLLDPFLSILFYAGLLVALWHWRTPPAGFVLLWLVVMLAPALLSEYAPHFRRAIGAAPALALLIGLGATSILRGLFHWRENRRDSWRVRPAMLAVITILLIGYAGSVSVMARDYFVRWASSPELFYAFDVGLADLAQRIAAEPADQTIYLSPRSPDHPTLSFFLRDHPGPRSFDGRHCFVLPPAGEPATYWIIGHEDWRGGELISRYLPEAKQTEQILDWQGKLYAQAYHQPAGGAIHTIPDISSSEQFGDWFKLRGWTVVNPGLSQGEVFYIDLFWKPIERTATSYTLFVHLLGDYNAETGGPVWAGTDSLPGAGSCPTTAWVPGEQIVDEIQVQIPDDLPAGVYQVEIGWYDLSTMQRAPLLDESGQVMGDSLILGEVSIHSAN